MLIKRALLVSSLVLFGVSGRSDAQAQTDSRNAEVGLHYTSIGLKAFDSREDGGGVRLSYNFNDYLAVEAEGNIFEFSIGDHPTDDFLAAQGLVGVKAGLRNRRVGVFAKLRPGVTNFPLLRANRRFCSIIQDCEGGSRSGNRFALDAGAVVELYPTENFIVRLDIGDTLIRFRNDSFFDSPTSVRIKDGFSHNFQFGLGVGFRF